jgi:predicted 2-oxoglutarate/Fe(II)-dependent dioxygenase YbiX
MTPIFWLQRMAKHNAQRTMLLELDMSIVRLMREHPGASTIMSLPGVCHNLMRMRAEPRGGIQRVNTENA